MLTILIAMSKHENLRQKIARIAVDHGLTQKLPFLFEGKLTPYNRLRVLAALRRACAGKRAFCLECYTLTREQAKRQMSLVGIN